MYKWCSDRFSILRENPHEEVDDENDNYYYNRKPFTSKWKKEM